MSIPANVVNSCVHCSGIQCVSRKLKPLLNELRKLSSGLFKNTFNWYSAYFFVLVSNLMNNKFLVRGFKSLRDALYLCKHNFSSHRLIFLDLCGKATKLKNVKHYSRVCLIHWQCNGIRTFQSQKDRASGKGMQV